MTVQDIGDLYLAGASIRDLARQHGVSRGTITRRLEGAGIPLRAPKTYPDDQQWWEAQLESERTAAEIAAELGCSTATVWRRLGAVRPAGTFEQWLGARAHPDGDCLRWSGAHTVDGYGLTTRQGRKTVAHLVVWTDHHGAPANGNVISHLCGNRDCVRIGHLRECAPAEVVARGVAAGRFPNGEDHWNHILTWSQVHAIRASNAPPDRLAAAYDVSPRTIRAVRARRRWRHEPHLQDTGATTRS